MTNPHNVQILLFKSSVLAEVLGVYDQVAAAYLNGASVTLTLRRTDGVAVTGQTWPLALAYVAASNGDYRGTISAAVAVRRGETLVAEVNIDGGTDKVRYFELPVRVEVAGP